MMPPAPARFSTTKGCVSASCSCVAIRRASSAATPPGAKAATTLTGLLGQAWARAGAGKAPARRAAAAPDRSWRRVRMVIEWSPGDDGESDAIGRAALSANDLAVGVDVFFQWLI